MSLWIMTVLIIMFYRQNLHLKYSQQFLTLFREWNVDMQKAQKQQEKLAVGISFGFKIDLFTVSKSQVAIGHAKTQERM